MSAKTPTSRQNPVVFKAVTGSTHKCFRHWSYKMHIAITVVYTLFLVFLVILIQIKGKNAAAQMKLLNYENLFKKKKRLRYYLYVYGLLFLTFYICAKIFYPNFLFLPAWLRVSLGLIFGVFSCLFVLSLINYFNVRRICKSRKNSSPAE